MQSDLILSTSSFLHLLSPPFLNVDGFSENLVLRIKKFLDLWRWYRGDKGTWEGHLNLRAQVVNTSGTAIVTKCEIHHYFPHLLGGRHLLSRNPS